MVGGERSESFESHGVSLREFDLSPGCEGDDGFRPVGRHPGGMTGPAILKFAAAVHRIHAETVVLKSF